jgi:hypothetical protein
LQRESKSISNTKTIYTLMPNEPESIPLSELMLYLSNDKYRDEFMNFQYFHKIKIRKSEIAYIDKNNILFNFVIYNEDENKLINSKGIFIKNQNVLVMNYNPRFDYYPVVILELKKRLYYNNNNIYINDNNSFRKLNYLFLNKNHTTFDTKKHKKIFNALWKYIMMKDSFYKKIMFYIYKFKYTSLF